MSSCVDARGGPLDIIEEGVNGHLVNVKDVGALAAQALRVLNLPGEDWRKMSEAAYRTATRYSWNDATDRFENALQLAVERNMRGELSWRRYHPQHPSKYVTQDLVVKDDATNRKGVNPDRST